MYNRIIGKCPMNIKSKPNKIKIRKRYIIGNMAQISKYKLTFFCLFLIFPIMATIYFVFFSIRFAREDTLLQTISLMKARINFLEEQYGKQEEKFRSQAKGNEVHVDNHYKVTYSPAVEALLKNISASRTANVVRSTESDERDERGVYVPMRPYVIQTDVNLSEHFPPGFIISNDRRFGRSVPEYIIGVPTVVRPRDSYLTRTVRHLLDGLTKEEKENTVILIYIGETNMEYVIRIAYSIEKEFTNELNSGLIEIISPGKDYYPDFRNIPVSLGDSPRRTKWRTKQNLDAIFLMSYAQSRCLYYLMLEDDVIASKGYMTEIKKYTASVSVSSPDWFYIQFSTTGGIGKLFRSTDLLRFIAYVQLFYANMPIDWLLITYLEDLKCGIDRDTKQCADAKSKIRPTYHKNLFKHIGLYSTLKGKIQKVQIPMEDQDAIEFVSHTNPSARVEVTMFEEPMHTVEYAYEGSTFAWLYNAKEGDYIVFWFERPAIVDSYKIFSGSAHHQKERLYDAVLEAKPANDNDFVQVDKADEFGMIENDMPQDFGPVDAMKIKFLKPSKYRLLITEIEFMTRNVTAANPDNN